ncbi:hypothetical protein C1752_08654 [Acaryochloris thomasi RCC1774]|uniref:Uncharacterized protein n=1 Tax=Acaryochloris thomasi RCC1774 TaxID=1764569 RepID=A0A2W1JAF9_9CYAN|nr:hypothetical protein [Acaryochloris thomasi]PZD70988.1 hypothetical protein C1752_08654 [Acaryochloris thomasi RCC1774]
MPDENYVKEQAPDLNEGGEQTPIAPGSRKAIDKMQADGRDTAMPESQPGSGNIAINSSATQSNVQHTEEKE